METHSTTTWLGLAVPVCLRDILSLNPSHPFLLLLLASLIGCTPVKEPVRKTPPSPPPRPATAAPANKPTPPSHPAQSPRITRSEVSGIIFEGVAFDSRTHRLAVVDQQSGPGSMFEDAAAAGHSRGALAAVNAGFFTPEGAPLGLVVSSGTRAGSWNSSSSLGCGLWLETAGGGSSIVRREKASPSAASSMRELLQAGPMLVENGHTVSGLDANKSSVRTLVLWDGGNRWWIGRTNSCTLAQLAAATSSSQPAAWPVHHALNLDGGRSSDLWISDRIPGGPLTRRAPWNKPVRNFMVLTPR